MFKFVIVIFLVYSAEYKLVRILPYNIVSRSPVTNTFHNFWSLFHVKFIES